MSFIGKVVLISGASSEIGAGAARHLSKLGANQSIVGRSEQRLHAVAEEIVGSNSPTPLSITADVSTDTERIIDETIKKFRKLDVLIMNAGIDLADDFGDVNFTELDRVFGINVRSVTNLTRFCVPYLEKTNGNIVNVLSVARANATDRISYCISKAALDQFTKGSAVNLAPKGIRVNSINAAHIRTNVFDSFALTSEQYEEALNSYIRRFPIGQFGEVPDINAAIAYLADDGSASSLTGIILPLDGGVNIAEEQNTQLSICREEAVSEISK